MCTSCCPDGVQRRFKESRRKKREKKEREVRERREREEGSGAGQE